MGRCAQSGSTGFARLVAPDDGANGRRLSNLAGLDIVSASPMPDPVHAALLLLGLPAAADVARQPAAPRSRATNGRPLCCR